MDVIDHIIANAEMAPDPRMQGMTDCFLVPLDDINNLKLAKSKLARIVEVLYECEEYFDNRADADCVGDPPHFVGNKEMQLLGEVREALKAAGEVI